MKSIVMTYPNFQELPKGIKMLLVASENHFFAEAVAQPVSVTVKGAGSKSTKATRVCDIKELFPDFSPAWNN